MNLRNIMKKPDPIAPEQPVRAGHERDAPAPRTRRRPDPVYPKEPTPAKVQQIDDLWDDQPVKRRRVIDVEKPDRDYLKLATTAMMLFFGIGGIAVGAILMTQPGTPNNMAWLHGENAVVLICVLLLMIKLK